MNASTSSTMLRMASGVSGSADGVSAAEQVCEACAGALGAGEVSLAILFVSAHHVPVAGAIAEVVRRELRAECLLGVSAEAVVGGRQELERGPGVSLLAARLPGVELTPFTADALLPYDETTEDGRSRLARGFGAGGAGTILLVDPFSVPMTGLLPALSRSAGRGVPIVGGLASAGSSPESNVLVLDDKVYRSGLVGVSLRGAVRLDAVVSQGCRAIGANWIVTSAKRNMVLKLGGRPALEVVREMVESMPEGDRTLLERGLFLGRVIDEYKDRFGRDDYLIRNVVGVDPAHEAIAVNDFVRVGQTVRFHLRDATTADEDLAMVLDAQQLREPPAGVMLVTCTARGRRLFNRPHHDAAAVSRAFGGPLAGERLSKGGEEIDTERPGVPLAGFFAGGEIGPVGGESYLHGHSACVAMFRPTA
ncbi:MAG: FIST C-terminal domain-containing protein [Phycisphaerae bacterium]|nr:FIST C-terminal domain-containing protein [Phycisphaerae bacterium]